MYLVKLFEGPMKDGGTNKPLFNGGVDYGQDDNGIDGPLRDLLKDVIRFKCGDASKRYFVQVFDEANQKWYKPWNGTGFEPPADGLIPVENGSQIGPLRL